jgi:hypothetical protein
MTSTQKKMLRYDTQWRNVISEGPRFKIFEGPPSRSAKGTSRAPYMHEFSRGSRACSSRKFLNLDSLKCHFLDFGERLHRILMVRKRHCNISEALANVFALSPKPGGPHSAHWGLGAPGFSRSEPIVVTPLTIRLEGKTDFSLTHVNHTLPSVLHVFCSREN